MTYKMDNLDAMWRVIELQCRRDDLVGFMATKATSKSERRRGMAMIGKIDRRVEALASRFDHARRFQEIHQSYGGQF